MAGKGLVDLKNMLVDLQTKTDWQQTNREHRNKDPGTNGENK